MSIGARIKEIRKAKGISVDYIAKELQVSKTTIYRYEDATIEKIPVNVFDQLCNILGVSAAQLMGNAPLEGYDKPPFAELPSEFKDAQSAMEFILKTPTLAAYGGYNPNNMSDDTIVEFANEILHQLELVSMKYKKL